MTIADFEAYLSTKRTSMDASIKEEINQARISAIEEKDEEKANYCWCLRQIFTIQNGFLCVYDYLRNKNFVDAWTKLDHIDIELGFLEDNFFIDPQNDRFNLIFIGRIIKEYQKLFPYKHFFSRENIIKSEKCSICGQPISLRKHCGHKPGKLYMGEMCLREITDMEFKAVAIVTDPFDKYSLVSIPNKEYDYGMLEWLMSYIKSPYDDFFVETKKEKLPEYRKTGRNDLCPCGSGKKYKKCHMGKPSELMDHHIVHMAGATRSSKTEVRYFGTWK